MSYQNIPGFSKKFERDCLERWRLIEPELPAEGVAVDIGAAEGYFCRQIAERTNLLAIAVEKHRGRVVFQHRWLNDSYLGKVVSCCGKFDTDFAKRLAATPEWFDVTLLMSVLHWINSDDFLKAIASMSGKVVIEIPDLNDTKATGQKFMARLREIGSEREYFEKITGRSVRLLGKVAAHTYPHRNLWIIEGDLYRENRTPHINYGKRTGITYVQEFVAGRLSYKKRSKKLPWIPGINLATLKELGVTWPGIRYWRAKIADSIDALDDKANDLRIHNVIISREKISWIDTFHKAGRNTITEDLDNLVKELT